jgi:L,D-transpeptidase catalytic domain/Putative peptidoglycan binding domain
VRLRTVFAALVAGLTALPVMAVLPAAVPGSASVAAADGVTSVYVSLPTPTRLLDTRASGTGLPVTAGATVNLAVTGAAPLPAPGATVAVVLNVTVVGPAGIGFWTVYPNDGARPLAANLNVDERFSALGAGLALPNLVTVPVGADGTVNIFSQSGGHVVVDMLGSYQASDAAAAGRLDPFDVPCSILDTRDFLAVNARSTIDVQVPDANGASAAVLSVATIAFDAGYWTFYPTGTEPPLAANLNSLYPFHIAANQVIVPLDASGRFSVYSQTGGHVIVDLVGLVTGTDAPVATEGLFVPLSTPTRFTDTRDPALNPLGGTQMALPTWNLEIPIAGNPAIGRTDVAAVSMNLTVTEALAAGYVTAGPAGTTDPNNKARSTATLNVGRPAQTLPSHAIVAVSGRGVDLFTQSGAHLIADVAGYYLGTPVPSPFGTPKNTDPTPTGCVGFPTTPVAPIVTGSSKGTVARAQQRLLDLGFWNAGADGNFGQTTSQAIMAFQKWTRLPASSVLDEGTAAALNRTLCRPTPGITSGDLLEVDKGKQLVFIIRGGKAQWVLNTSTGGGYDYTATDKKTGERIEDTAITPNGTFKVYRVSDDPAYFGSLGELYRPRFVVGGVAVHGYRSIPNYPASHGCIRVSNAAMDMIWATNAMPLGSRVVIHD